MSLQFTEQRRHLDVTRSTSVLYCPPVVETQTPEGAVDRIEFFPILFDYVITALLFLFFEGHYKVLFRNTLLVPAKYSESS